MARKSVASGKKLDRFSFLFWLLQEIQLFSRIVFPLFAEIISAAADRNGFICSSWFQAGGPGQETAAAAASAAWFSS